MRYMCLIYENEAIAAARSDEEQQKIMEGYFAFNAIVRDAGVMETGEMLRENSGVSGAHLR